jgi:DNA segregation ATPase FtsK/SpoIIIE, S-DNA-T family
VADTALSRRISEIVGIAGFAAALLWLISLATYSDQDPAWFFNNFKGDAANLAGRFGAFLASVSFQVFGYTAFMLPVLIGYIAWHRFWCSDIESGYTKLAGSFVLVMCVAGLSTLASSTMALEARVADDSFGPGGMLGYVAAEGLRSFLSTTGATIVLLTCAALAIVVTTRFSFGRAAQHVAGRVRKSPGVLTRLRTWREDRRREKERKQIVDKHVKKADRDRAEIESKAANGAEQLRNARDKAKKDDALADKEIRPADPKATRPPAIRAPQPVPQALPLAEVEKAPVERRQGAYLLPPHSILDSPKEAFKVDERELRESARLLGEKLGEFSVEGSVTQIHPGPVVTTYEFQPDAGVKYSRITVLSDDLCLAMRAESVLIDRIAGKSTVGIQIPNPQRETITLRELLESEVTARAASRLTMCLGKTIHGDPFVSDLATMPHLLIAGSTGAGKSVSVNAMVSSILFRATPDEVRFIMIDPKRLELGMYEDIPHLLTPVVVDPKQAANALRWAVREMEERYKLLAANGVRNIDQFNRNVKGQLAEQSDAKGPDGKPLKTLPFIVVIIDELADLMMVAGKEVEESICRLAQMARAVGIHLILATQRPSVDVITGVIKANLPARIAFRVASRIDSRTILDANGAEQLLGKGDMLYLPPAASRPVRIHGPYISEQETARLASFLKKQGKPIYDTSITAEEKTSTESGKPEFEKDDLYDEAARIVVSTGQPSISYLQRRLRIGFSRAARLIDMMEVEGVVSPAAGGKREVLVDQSYFEEVDAQPR